MFKKFESKENISGISNVKSTVQKAFRNKIIEQYPHLEDYIDQIIPKKDPLRVAKCQDHIEILVGKENEPTFFRQREGFLFPTIRILHKYPFMMPVMQVDKGAIKFILSGANIMCPGLTSAGAKMTKVDKDTVVAVMAEGKEDALAIGLTSMSTIDILKINKGIAIENMHYLNDGLWHLKTIK